jgi:hypothetical protein
LVLLQLLKYSSCSVPVKLEHKNLEHPLGCSSSKSPDDFDEVARPTLIHLDHPATLASIHFFLISLAKQYFEQRTYFLFFKKN